jgi:hypothetical protein
MRRTRFVQGRVDAITPTPTPTPTASAPVNSALPSISGTAVKGQTLTASTGSWLNLPTGFAYQWASGGSAIPGAVSQTYVLAQSDVGASITCAVVASNAAGSGTATSSALGPVLDLAPVNTVAPVLSGTATVGQTLSVTNGTWTNPPTSYSYDWRRNGTSIGAANQNTYGLTVTDNGANITCVVTATNSGGSVSASSNSLGPVGTVSLATPTLANFSALGTAPLTLEWSTTDFIAGDYAQLEIDQTSGAFSNVVQNIIFFIDGTSWATLDESIGLITPSGTYWARIRTCRENESGVTSVTGNDKLGNSVTFNADVSSWSTTFTDTISASAAALNTTTGVNKSSFMTVSGSPALTWAGTSGGGKDAVRTTIEQANNKAQFEFTVSATGDLFIGVEDGTTDFSALNKVPGVDNSAGIALEMNGTTGFGVWYNTSGTFVDLGSGAGAIAVGDKFTFVFDKVNHTLEVWRTRSGTTVQMGSTLTSVPTLTHYFSFAAANSTNGGGTMNYGGTTYAKTPGTGVASVWA